MSEAGAGKTPIWQRNLVVLAGSQLLAVTAMAIVLPFLPFFVRELGVVERAAVERWSGLIFSAPFLTAAAFSPVWGHLGDKYGHRWMVARAIAGLALVNFLYMFVQTPLQFWMLRFVQGAVSGFIPAALAITTSGTPPRHLTGALGKLHASSSAGRLIGPAIGGILAGMMAFRGIFLVVAVLTSIAGVAVVLFLREPPRTGPRTPTTAAGNLRFVLKDVRIQLTLVGLMVSMAAMSMAMPVFPLYVEDLLPAGRDASLLTGVGFAVVAATTLVTASFLGRISGAVGLKNLLIGALVVAGIALILHGRVSGVAGMLAVRALLGVGGAGVQPTLFSMVSRLAPQEMRGGITGYASGGTILGFFVGPLAGGWLANVVGVRGVFEIAGVIALAGAAAAAVIAKRRGRERKLATVPTQTPR